MPREVTSINFIGNYPSNKAKLHLEKLLLNVQHRLEEAQLAEGTTIKMNYYNSYEGPQTCTLRIQTPTKSVMFTRAGANAFQISPQLYRDMEAYIQSRKADTVLTKKNCQKQKEEKRRSYD